MSGELIPSTDSRRGLPLPPPRVPIRIRVGTLDDVPFMDALQKKTTKQVGWMPTKQFEGKVKAGAVLVACAAVESGQSRVESCSAAPRDDASNASPDSPLSTSNSSLIRPNSPLSTDNSPLGYLIAHDRYFKRDDVGIIYQINVVPEYRRSLVAASLLKAQFERSAYGCKLYCCWCAQDIEANRFWESMGFVPLAFRTGGKAKGKRQAARVNSDPSSPLASCPLPVASHRVHIFWQKRIRAGDTSTPWWFPSQTSGGSIREDRIVLPIPPGVRWSEAKPIVLPGTAPALEAEPTKRLPGPRVRVKKPERVGIAEGGLRFVQPQADAGPKPKREPRRVAKNDPQMVAAARELRDRWLEHVNAQDEAIGSTQAKYELGRAIEGETVVKTRKLLAA
ncbi:MAG: GNAT family N-acetyltransferase [Tepidisphaeraceae bacterium]